VNVIGLCRRVLIATAVRRTLTLNATAREPHRPENDHIVADAERDAGVTKAAVDTAAEDGVELARRPVTVTVTL
jgi:hypothetical protein